MATHMEETDMLARISSGDLVALDATHVSPSTEPL